MIKRLRVLAYIILVIIAPSLAVADVNRELNKFFDNLGMASNITAGGAYHDQRGGYYTGGNIYARSKVSNTNLMNIQPPSFSAGCGGIDLFKGGMSFINAEQFLNAIRHIGGNVAGYSMNLAMQTMAPQVYNTIQKLNDIAREINSMNINSCEMAATTLAGVWPRSDASSRYLCNVVGTHKKSIFSDWAESRQGCGAQGKRDEVNKARPGEFEGILGDEFNLVWAAISKNSFLNSDKELAELFMSITGTIVAKKEGSGQESKIKHIHYAPLALSDDLVESLMYGTTSSTDLRAAKKVSEAEIYKCLDTKTDEKCLNITKSPLTLIKGVALVPKIEDLLRGIATKAASYSDKSLSEEEKGLVESTRIPIFKIVLVQSAFKRGSSVVNMTEFAEPIAHDVVLNFMEQVLDVVNQNLKELESAQIDGTMIAEFKQELRATRKLVLDKRHGIYQQMLATLNIIEQTKSLEGQVQDVFTNAN